MRKYLIILSMLTLRNKEEDMISAPLIALNTLTIVLIAIAAVLLIAVLVLFIVGKRAEKKQEGQEKMMEENAQVINLFVIDKKKMRLKDAGLPQVVIEQSPKLAKMAKIPVVKVKAGPRVMNLIADNKIWDQIVPKQDVKATVSGIYITNVQRLRGPAAQPKKKKRR